MNELREAIRNAVVRLFSKRHVTLLNGVDGPVPDNHPAAIVAGVPDVRLDQAPELFGGRRKRLRLVLDSKRVTLLARCRPLPERVLGSVRGIQWATDRYDRRVPLSYFDCRTRTIHLLVDLSTCSVVDVAVEVDAVSTIVGILFRRPLEALLRGFDAVTVGPDVHGEIRRLLTADQGDAREPMRRELTSLERMAGVAELPRVLSERIDNLKRLLTPAPPPRPEIDDGRVEFEVGRLANLIRSRACAALEFGGSRIRGLINPRPLDARWGVIPMGFELRLRSCTGRHPSLCLWDAAQPEPEPKRGQCLGEGYIVFDQTERAGDLYGSVDVVLNFVETNNLGVISLDGARRRRRSFAELVAALI